MYRKTLNWLRSSNAGSAPASHERAPKHPDAVPVKRSFAQSGEDLIAAYVLHSLRIDQPNYLDIGAYKPVEFSNTYHFYERGLEGCCVEANPDLAQAYQSVRSRDRVVNAAVSGRELAVRPFM